MPETLVSDYDKLVNQLKEEGRWTEKSAEESAAIIQKMEAEMAAFRIENQRKAIASIEEMAVLRLTD